MLNGTGLVKNPAPEDIGHLVNSQLAHANLLIAPLSAPQIRDRTFKANADIWEALIEQRARSSLTVTLQNFFLSEWFPRSPGLFFTREGQKARLQARHFVEVMDRGISEDQYAVDALGDKVTVFNPHGKMAMLQGGIGCIRLKPRRIEGADLWFMSATSTGVVHEGLPVAMPDQLYQESISEIAEKGACIRTIIGKLRFVPDSLVSLYTGYRSVPQLYLLVEELKPPVFPANQEQANIDVSVAISFLSNYEGPRRVYASYVYFDPSRRESFERNVGWMEKTYVDTYRGTIVTDFDEQMARFATATFSLKKVMDLELDRNDVETTIRELHIHGNVDKLFEGVEKVTMNQNKQIRFGDHAHIGGSVVLADEIRESFNQIQESSLDNELKGMLEELATQLTSVTAKMTPDLAQQAARNFKALSEEIRQPKPQRRWFEVSLDGLREAALAVGDVGKPIIATTAKVLPLLLKLFPG